MAGRWSTTVLEWLLDLERGFGGAESVFRPVACSGRWLAVALVITLIGIHYYLAFAYVVPHFNNPLGTSIGEVFDFLTVVILLSTPWDAPLTLCLGLDNNGRAGQNFVFSPALSARAMLDPTLRRIGYASILAFLVGICGDCMLFMPFYGRDGAEPFPLHIKILYVFGSAVTNVGLALGPGYVALAHNLFAVQLETLAHRLEHGGEGEDDQAPPYGSMDSNGDENETIMTSDVSLSPKELALTWVELRRRMEALASSFHKKVGFAVLVYGLLLIMVVTECFEHERDYLSDGQMIGLVLMFLTNSISLWFMAITFGRVHFCSREECTFAAHKWAILKQEREVDRVAAMDTATMVARCPIMFHAGIFELTEETSKAVTFLLLGLMGIFFGVNVPEV